MADTNQNAKLFAELFGKNTNIVVGSIGSQTAAGTIAQIQTANGAIAANTLRDMKPGVVLLFQASNGLWYCVNADQKATEVISSDVIYKRKTSPVSQPLPPGKIKVLYYLHENGRINFYIGGDREEPEKIFDIPAVIQEGSHNYLANIYGFINNTGASANDWIVQIKYAYTTIQWEEKFADEFAEKKDFLGSSDALVRAEFGMISDSPIFPSSRVETGGKFFGAYPAYSDTEIADKYPRHYAVTIKSDKQWKIEGEDAAAITPIGYGFWVANNDVIFPVCSNLLGYDHAPIPQNHGEVRRDFGGFYDIRSEVYSTIIPDDALPKGASYLEYSPAVSYTASFPGTSIEEGQTAAVIRIGYSLETKLEMSSVFPTFLDANIVATRKHPRISPPAYRADIGITGVGDTGAISCYLSEILKIDKGSWEISYSNVGNQKPDGNYLPSTINGKSKIKSKIAILPEVFVDGFSYEYAHTDGSIAKTAISSASNLLLVNQDLSNAIVLKEEEKEAVGIGFGAFKFIPNAYIRNDGSLAKFHVADPLGGYLYSPQFTPFVGEIYPGGFRGWPYVLQYSPGPETRVRYISGLFSASITADFGGGTTTYTGTMSTFGEPYFIFTDVHVWRGTYGSWFVTPSSGSVIFPYVLLEYDTREVQRAFTSYATDPSFLLYKNKSASPDPRWYPKLPGWVFTPKILSQFEYSTYGNPQEVEPLLFPEPLAVTKASILLYSLGGEDRKTPMSSPIENPVNFQGIDRIQAPKYRRFTSFIKQNLYCVDFLTLNTIESKYIPWALRAAPTAYKKGDRFAVVEEQIEESNYTSPPPNGTKWKKTERININTETGQRDTQTEETSGSTLSFSYIDTRGVRRVRSKDCSNESIKKAVCYLATSDTDGVPDSQGVAGAWQETQLGDITKEVVTVSIAQYKITGTQITRGETLQSKVYPLKNLTKERSVILSNWPATTGSSEHTDFARAENVHFILSASYHP